MGRLLVQIAVGTQDATRACLGLLVARTALASGHDVDVFLAGDAVHAVRSETRALLQGIGTGSAAEHWQALRDGGARLYASGMSSKARGLSADAAGAEGAELAPPERLVELVFEADRVLVY